MTVPVCSSVPVTFTPSTLLRPVAPTPAAPPAAVVAARTTPTGATTATTVTPLPLPLPLPSPTAGDASPVGAPAPPSEEPPRGRDLAVVGSDRKPSGPVTARRRREQQTEELLGRAAQADEPERRRIVDEVVVLNLPVARALARRYRGRGEPLDDLVQVASLALVKAAHGYRPGLGRDFLAYAVPTISGELRRHFRDHGWDLRPPRRLQEVRMALTGVVGDLTQELGRAPRIAEVAERVGVDVEEVRETLGAMRSYAAVSLDAPADGRDGTSLAETVGLPDRSFEAVEAHLVVRPLLAELPERDRRILTLRFFGGLTQSQIGDEIGVTQMQVSRLITQALRRLRETMESEPVPLSA